MEDYFKIKPSYRYGIDVFGTSYFIKNRFMFNRKRRIDKKWKKNQEYFLIKEINGGAKYLIQSGI